MEAKWDSGSSNRQKRQGQKSRGVTRDPQASQKAPKVAVPRVLVSGIDTLHLFSTGELREDLARELEDLKAQARAAETNREALPMISLGGQSFMVSPRSARTSPYLLTSETMELKLDPKPPKNLPNALMEIRSLGLWQAGAAASVERARAVFDAITAPPLAGAARPDLEVTRVDLCADIQGWRPTDADRSRFKARAKEKASYEHGKQFTGIRFGTGDLSARIYDKTEEIKKSDKTWFFAIWAASDAYRPGEPVWRVEFQLRRGALRTFRQAEDDQHVLTWGEVRDNARTLWRNLMRGWLSMREPRTAQTRQRLTQEWAILIRDAFKDAIWDGTDASLYRVAKEDAYSRTMAQLAGYVVRGLAERYYRGGLESFEEAGPRMLEEVRRLVEHDGSPIEEQAKAKADAWRAKESDALNGRAKLGAQG